MTATPKLQLNHTLDQLQKHLVIRDKSPNTIYVYHYTAEQFYHLYPQFIPRNLQLYKVYLLKHYKPQAVNLRTWTLNCFMGHRQTSITPVSVIKIQQKTYPGKTISQGDYEYLKRKLMENGGCTYYFIIRLITATRVRASELITFQIEDIHRGHRDIYFKGNKMRRTYIPTTLKGEFRQWLLTACYTVGPLSLNRSGSLISPSGIRSQFKIFAIRYGLGPGVVYPHNSRHRLIRDFIEKYGDISLLSDPLGHENIETTRIYLRRSSSEQYRTVNRVMDR